jgi:hypothetical protein
MGITPRHNQHRRYFRKRKDITCPRVLFRKHLLQALTSWQEDGEKLILLMDANECLETGQLAKDLIALGMHDAIKTRTNSPGPPTFQSGSKQIDGIWMSSDLLAQSASFLPLFVGVGDHRMALVDIPNDMLLGTLLKKISRATARRLQTKLPKSASKYQELLTSYVMEHKLLPKFRDIYVRQSVPLLPADQQELNRLDKTLADGMRHAEKKCRTLRMGELDFSPQLSKAKERVSVWNLVIKKLGGGKVSSSLIKRQAHKCGISKPLSITFSEAQRALKAAEEQHDAMRPQHEVLRDSYLAGRFQNATNKNDIRLANKVKRDLSIHRMKSEWRSIKRAVGKQNGGSVREIETVIDGEQVKCSTENEVVEAISENNVSRFNLTILTPLMRESMSTLLGYMAVTESAEEILNGSFIPPSGTDTYTVQMLDALKRPLPSAMAPTSESFGQIDTSITKEDFQDYWRKANERISSSWSQLHFGHYIAASKDDLLSEIHAIKLHIAVNTGHSFPRWKKGLTVMLEKTPGVILVEKLRAILLMEADFNFTNKLLFGCRLVHQAEKSGNLHPDADGSRKHRPCIATSLDNRLVHDIHRQQRLAGASASVDAAQCYDRMVHSFVSLVCQHLGMPQATIMAMLTTIQEMQFHLRTSFGDSNTFYGGKLPIPFQGTCQGNGAGPAIWLIVVSRILRNLQSEGHGMHFESAITKASLAIVAFCYVDDTTLGVTAKSHFESPEQIVTRLQSSIDCWSGSLTTTGGALKPIKCFWSIYYFIWKNGEPEYAKISHNPNLTVTVLDHSMEQTPIDRIDVDDAREMLGLWQCVSGKMTKQLEVLQEKVDIWTKSLQTGHISRNLAWKAYKGTICKSIDYVLPATTFKEEEMKNFHKALHTPILPALGANRNFPHLFRSVPSTFFGLDLFDSITEQGIHHIHTLLTHGMMPTRTGNLVRISIELLQLELGLPGCFFHHSYDIYGYLATESWVECLWRFTSKYTIVLENDDYVPLPMQRKNDEFLTTLFASLDPDPPSFRSLNRCRQYLQAYSLACITTGDGLQITQNAFNLVAPPACEQSKYKWTHQFPTIKDRTIWKKVLICLFGKYLRIPTPLGAWICESHKRQPWMYHRGSQVLYHQTDRGWHVFKSSQQYSLRHSQSMSRISVVPSAPEHLEVASTRKASPGSIIFEGSAPKLILPVTQRKTILATIKSWPNNWPFQHMQLIGNEIAFARCIEKGSIAACCDGSYMKELDANRGSTCLIMECQKTKQRFTICCQSPGTHANAYRAEMMGLYLAMCITHAFCLTYNIQSGHISLSCDNDGCLWRTAMTVPKVSHRQKHSDILRAIHFLKLQIPISWTFSEVKGHQDDFIQYEDLDRVSQLNVMCDAEAKRFLVTAIDQNASQPYKIPFQGWRCQVLSDWQTDEVGPAVRKCIGRQRARDHLSMNGRLPSSVFDLIQWDPIGDHLDSSPQLYRLWAIKHVSRFCATGKMMFAMKKWKDAKCPCCRLVTETTDHLSLCSDPDMETCFMDSVIDFSNWLEEHDCEPDLAKFFISYLSLRNKSTFSTLQGLPWKLYRIGAEIDYIRWHHVLEGKLPQSLYTLQANYLQEIGSRQNIKTWSASFVGGLLQILHTMWLHRCDVVHLREADGLKVQESQDLQNEIIQEYILGSYHLPTEDMHLLEPSLDELLALHGPEKKAWLDTIRIARQFHPSHS